MDDRPTSTDAAGRVSRFELAPPRHFVLPAILLLLSERAGYGYQLVKDLEELRFGRIDRPTVYRALSQLEADALVESWLEAPTAGQNRRVYGLTALGAEVLRAWMGVIKEERDGLARVLRRYQATGTIDAVLAEVDGAWSADLRPTSSPVSPTWPDRRRHSIVLDPGDGGPVPGEPAPSVGSAGATGSSAAGPAAPAAAGNGTDPRPAFPTDARRFALVPDRSVVMIEARSSVGPITFGAVGLTGWIEAVVGHGVIRPGTQPKAYVEIAIDGLRSGNSLYDAELLRRINARRFPVATLDLQDTVVVGTGSRYRLAGELEFHGVKRSVNGSVEVVVLSDRRLRVTGEQEFDIRDYDLRSPTVLMLRIYPDVRVHLHVEAELDG